MTSPSISVLGVFKVPADDALFEQAIDLKYGGIALSAEQRREAESAVRSELASIVLLECQVSAADGKFKIGDFGQPDSDQAAYDEAFLSDDGTTLAARRYTQPSTPDFRLCFFLHFFDPQKPLRTSYGTVQLPPVSAMPDRLRRLIQYDPVT